MKTDGSIGYAWADGEAGSGAVMGAASESEAGLTPERRALLARKGEIVYARFCGTEGRGICAENLAIHQLRIGHDEIVRDLLRFLEGRLASLGPGDPEGWREMTEGLVARIRALIEGA